ncbi:hypothetical protein BGW80DRAFT_1374570 [Lactifluus volemus]|nr:hypothetical protein BGW80DRAFT_1374570 [Lactifluus volemus]
MVKLATQAVLDQRSLQIKPVFQERGFRRNARRHALMESSGREGWSQANQGASIASNMMDIPLPG